MNTRLISFLSAAGIAVSAHAASADIIGLWFGGQTTSFSNPGDNRVDFWVEPTSDSAAHLPDDIQSITLIAPTKETFAIDRYDDLDFPNDGYFRILVPGDFSGGKIPAGAWRVVIVDAGGRTTGASDVIPNIFLGVPTITNPQAGGQLGRVGVLRWTPVRGAHVYRVTLYDHTWQQAVFGTGNGDKRLNVKRNFAILPQGVLKPDHSYSLRVEARTTLQDSDRRGRSDTIQFSTRTW